MRKCSCDRGIRGSALLLAALGMSLAPAQSRAQSAPASSSTSSPGPSPQAVEEADASFNRGLELYDRQAWEPALAEFLHSWDLAPAVGSAKNAGLCLEQLGRYDEALNTFERVIREFPNIKEDKKKEVQQAIVRLRPNVGTIDVTGGEPGAQILIDNRPRGEFPPVNPLRVSAGEHLVRLLKEGYEPAEVRVSVAGGTSVATSPMRMLEIKDAGKLKVIESSGRNVGVFVDGVRVGETPWEGSVSVGRHMVLLRGDGIWGTAPVNTSVKARSLTSLSLKAQELDARLQITPAPAGAQIALDSVVLGNGMWEGLLPSGAHKIEVSADGFKLVTRSVNLAPGDQQALSIKLDRDDDADIWQKPRNFVVDVTSGFTVFPSLGGALSDGCSAAPCSQLVGLGAMGIASLTYELGSGIGVGVSGGSLFVQQRTSGRTSTFTPNGLDPSVGKVDDDVRLTGWMVGGLISYRFESIPVFLRLGLGINFATLRDERAGSFTAGDGGTVTPDRVADFVDGYFAYLMPEVRVARKFGERWEVGLFVQALALFPVPQPPRFQSTKHEAGGADMSSPFLGTYAPDTLTSDKVVFGVAPGISARFAYELPRKARSTAQRKSTEAVSSFSW